MGVGMDNFDDGEFDQYLPPGVSSVNQGNNRSGSHMTSAGSMPPPPPYGPGQQPTQPQQGNTTGGPGNVQQSGTPTTWANSACRMSTTSCSSASGVLQRMASSQGNSTSESPINLSPGNPDLHSNPTIPTQPQPPQQQQQQQQQVSPSYHSNSSPTSSDTQPSDSKMDLMSQYQRDQRYNYELHMARYGYHSNPHVSSMDHSADYPGVGTGSGQQYYPGIPSNPYQCMAAGIRTMYQMPNSLYHQ